MAAQIIRPVNAQLNLRKATVEDALTLSVLAKQVFLDTYATRGVNTDLAKEVMSVYAAEVFRKRLRRGDVEILIAEKAGYLVAFADMTPSTQCPASGVVGLEVFRLYVQEPFHGQGIGRELMGVAERRARDGGMPYVWLTAWSGNHNALAFYRRLGYQDQGATEYLIEGIAYENRVMAKHVVPSAASRSS